MSSPGGSRRRLMPEETAASLDAVENLVLGQLANDVAAVAAGEFSVPVDRQRLVKAISAATPLGKATLAKRMLVYRLLAEVIEHRQLKLIAATCRVGPSVNERLSSRERFQEHFVTGGDIAVRGQREAVLRDAAEMVCLRSQARAGKMNFQAIFAGFGLPRAKLVDERLRLGRRRIGPAAELVRRLDLNPAGMKPAADEGDALGQAGNLIVRDRQPQGVVVTCLVQSLDRPQDLRRRRLAEQRQAMSVVRGGEPVE